jgi:hypothetical protein
LEWILEEHCVRAWTLLKWLRMWSNVSVKKELFLYQLLIIFSRKILPLGNVDFDVQFGQYKIRQS